MVLFGLINCTLPNVSLYLYKIYNQVSADFDFCYEDEFYSEALKIVLKSLLNSFF